MVELVVALQLTISIVLVISSISKVLDMQRFHESLVRSGYSSGTASRAKWLVPAAESVVASMILSPGSIANIGAAVSTVMFAVFTWYVIVAVRNGRSCNCFGVLSTEKASWVSVLRNTILFVGTAYLTSVLWRGDGVEHGAVQSLVIAFVELNTPVRLVIVSTWVSIGLFSVFLLGFLARWSSGDGSSKAISVGTEFGKAEGNVDRPIGKPIGATLPDVVLEDATGSTVPLSSLLKHFGGQVLMVFTDPACQACRAIDQYIPTWLSPTASPNVIVITRRAVANTQAERQEWENSSGVYLQRNFEVASAVGTNGTPSAVGVSIDNSGAILVATETVVSAVKVQALVANMHWQ